MINHGQLVNGLSNGFVFADDVINEITYGQKLHLYWTFSKKTKSDIADKLGVTLRTLGEFMRPSGRTPSKYIQKLIDAHLTEIYPLK